VVDIVPQLLSKSEDFSIGGATFHLRKSLVDQAPPNIKGILDALGPAEIRLILEVRSNDVVCYRDPPPSIVKQPYTDLVTLGLFKEATKEEKKEQESEGYPCGYGVGTTPQFATIRDFMIMAISDAIQQSRTLPESKPTTIKKGT
jgi:hypothetical protein